MAATNPQTVLNGGTCFACYGVSVAEMMKLSLLDTISQTIGGVTPSIPIEIFDLLEYNFNVTATSPTVTPAFTPTANRLILCTIYSYTPTLIAGPPISVTGNGLTWVLVNSVSQKSSPDKYNMQVATYRAMGAAPVNGALTITWGTGPNASYVSVVEFSNVDTSGTDGSGAIAQSGVSGNSTSANPSLALAAFNASGNNAGIAFSSNTHAPTYIGTPKAGWTELVDANGVGGIFTVGAYCEYRLATTDNAIAITAGAAQWALLALEINAA